MAHLEEAALRAVRRDDADARAMRWKQSLQRLEQAHHVRRLGAVAQARALAHLAPGGHIVQ